MSKLVRAVRPAARSISISSPRWGFWAPERAPLEIDSELVLFVRSLCTGTSPALLSGAAIDPSKCRRFSPCPSELSHAVEMLGRVPELRTLRDSEVPTRRSEAQFWCCYFALVRRHLKATCGPMPALDLHETENGGTSPTCATSCRDIVSSPLDVSH
eukprot:m51a1_g8788 hypothetical protein (157) ;mRNA; r:221191-221849